MSANLRAFLALVRWCEGTSGENGYRTIVGGELFDSFNDHPRIRKSGVFNNGKAWSSDAAGAYQFLSTTWSDCRDACNLPDFSPASQDEAAVFLIKRAGALHAVEQGDLRNAIHLCCKTWASLPGAPYGQPVKTYDACAVIFERAGGTIMQAAGATPRTAPPAPEPSAPSLKEQIMAAPALIIAAAQALLPFIADLMRERGTKTSTRNSDILDRAPELVPIILEMGRAVVPDAVNEQDMAQQIAGSKELQTQLRAQAAVRWSDIRPFLEFDEESREKARGFAEKMTEGSDWKAVGYGLILYTLIIIVVGGGGYMLWTMAISPLTDANTKGMIVGAVIAGVTMILQFFFGSSRGSQIKDQTALEQAKGK